MRRGCRSLCAAVAITAGIVLSGCSSSIAIDTPASDGASVCSPVQVVATWTGTVVNNTFSFTLDNVDVTSQFAVDYNARRATAQLAAGTGSHVLVADVNFPGPTGPSNRKATRTFVAGQALTVTANPGSLQLPRNGNTSTAVAVSGCQGTAAVVLSGLPPGITANPQTFQANVPSSRTVALQASAAVPTGRYAAAINATAPGLSASTPLTIDVGTPSISGVTPTMRPTGGSVTIAGSGFDPVCAMNTVTIGGATVAPTTCAPAGTSLSIVVPSQASYGSTQIAVSVAGLTSNAVAFTVSREPGAFVDITDDVSNQIASGRTCTGGPGGSVRLDVSGTSPFSASYVRLTTPPATAGAIAFKKDTPLITAYPGGAGEVIQNLGGAGFSLCRLGVVLDADARADAQRVLAVRLLDLQTGTKGTPYGFDYYSPAGQQGNTYLYTRSAPTIFRSQDGTIILVEHPSTTAINRVAIGVIDATRLGQPGQLIRIVETSATQAGFASAQLNASNQIVVTVAGTTYPAIPIQ